MGREASAVTKLFFKPEGLDVFPSAGPWSWMAGVTKILSFQEGISEDAQDTPAWHILQPLLSLRSELSLKSLFGCRDQTSDSDLAHKPVTVCFYLLPGICMH